MAVVLHRSTDAGSAALDDQLGSCVNVWDQCLVNGNATAGKAAAGWTKSTSGTNQGVYRMNTVAGVGHYVHLQDAGPNTSAVGREARARGWVASTGLGTGTEPFPTVTQVADANGPMIRKSMGGGAGSPREWLFVGNERAFHFFTKPGDFGNNWSAYSFGEYKSRKGTSDLFRTYLMSRVVSGGAGNALATSEVVDTFSALTAAIAGHYTPRNINNDIVGAVNIGKHGNSAHSAALSVGLCPYPSPADDSLLVHPITLHSPMGGGVPVGTVPGLWHWCHPAGTNVADGFTWAGSGDLAGKTFMKVGPNALGTAIYVVEISNTWDMN